MSHHVSHPISSHFWFPKLRPQLAWRALGRRSHSSCKQWPHRTAKQNRAVCWHHLGMPQTQSSSCLQVAPRSVPCMAACNQKVFNQVCGTFAPTPAGWLRRMASSQPIWNLTQKVATKPLPASIAATAMLQHKQIWLQHESQDQGFWSQADLGSP